MNLIAPCKKIISQFFILIISLSILISVVAAVGLSGEEKTIFTAEEGACIYSAMDSGKNWQNIPHLLVLASILIIILPYGLQNPKKGTILRGNSISMHIISMKKNPLK